MGKTARTEKILQVYVLVAIVIIGTAARMTGIGFGLPNTETRPDESTSVSMALFMARNGFHPHSFIYPTLFPTILLFLYGVHFVTGYVSGRFASMEDFKALYFTDPSSFYLIARMVGAVSGILTIYFIYVLGRRLYGVSVGLLSALFLALCPLHVRNSHFGNVDVPMTCLFVLAAVFVLDVYRRGRLRDYFLSGVISGLATSVKYPAGILCLNILAAHLIRGTGPERTGWRALFHPSLWAAALAMGATFLTCSPYILIDWQGFRRDFQTVINVMTGAHGGYKVGIYGAGWVYHGMFSIRYGLGLWMEALAMVGVIWAAFSRKPAEYIVLSFLIYFLTIGNGRWVFMRFAIPIIPILLIFAAAALLRFGRMLRDQRWRVSVLVGVVALVLADPLYSVVQFNRILLREDTRLQAAAWIRAHVPDGSVIALHGGSLYAEPQLSESEDTLRERLKREGGHRDAYLIAHPVSPRYRLIRFGYWVRGSGADGVEMSYDWTTLRKRSVDYVVTQEFPLKAFATVDDRMRVILNGQAVPVAIFDPFTPGVSSRPVYDPIDAFFVPVAGFRGTERPGPKITVYRLHPEELSTAEARP